MAPVGARVQAEPAEGRIRWRDPVGIDGHPLGGAIENARGAPHIFPKDDTVGGFTRCAVRPGANILERVHPLVVVDGVGHRGESQLALVGDAHRHLAFVFGLAQGWQQQRGQDGNDRDDNEQLDQHKAARITHSSTQVHGCRIR